MRGEKTHEEDVRKRDEKTEKEEHGETIVVKGANTVLQEYSKQHRKPNHGALL